MSLSRAASRASRGRDRAVFAGFATSLATSALLVSACGRFDAGTSSERRPDPAIEALVYVAPSAGGDPGFLVDRFETTVARWRVSGRTERSTTDAGLEDGPSAVDAAGAGAPPASEGPGPDRAVADDRPVVRVTAYEAESFAASIGGRLPTAEEWERACSLPGEDDRRFPWGHAYSSLFCNSLDLALGGTTRVGVFESGRSPWGVYDLAGNVREWTATEVRGRRIVKGGSFNTLGPRTGAVSRRPSRLEVHHRDDLLEPGAYAFDLGFRAVYDLAPRVELLARDAASVRDGGTSDAFATLVGLARIAGSGLEESFPSLPPESRAIVRRALDAAHDAASP